MALGSSAVWDPIALGGLPRQAIFSQRALGAIGAELNMPPKARVFRTHGGARALAEHREDLSGAEAITCGLFCHNAERRLCPRPALRPAAARTPGVRSHQKVEAIVAGLISLSLKVTLGCWLGYNLSLKATGMLAAARNGGSEAPAERYVET